MKNLQGNYPFHPAPKNDDVQDSSYDDDESDNDGEHE